MSFTLSTLTFYCIISFGAGEFCGVGNRGSCQGCKMPGQGGWRTSGVCVFCFLGGI